MCIAACEHPAIKPESVQAQTSKVGVGASAGQMGLANRAQKLTKVGVDTPAHIDAMTATGNTDTPGAPSTTSR